MVTALRVRARGLQLNRTVAVSSAPRARDCETHSQQIPERLAGKAQAAGAQEVACEDVLCDGAQHR